MLQLWSPDKLLARLLPPQKLSPDRVYRRSQFAFPFDAEGRRCLYHTLTKQCLDLEGLVLPEGPMTGATLSRSAELTQLAQGFFFVPEDSDECARYESVVRLLRQLNHKAGRRGYNILTTTACNARCVYCFEEDLKPVHMSPETTERVLDFILKTRCPDEKLLMSWFGGEPLVNTHPIDHICAALSERDIPFESHITSNGSMIDDAVLDRMTGLWRMKQVQLSMDGDEQTYIRRKNYRHYQDDYHRVIDAANRMVGQGIHVTIRVNVDWENLDGVDRLIDDLGGVLDNYKLCSVCIRPLYGEWTRDDTPELWDRIGAYHLALERRGYNASPGIDLRKLKRYNCMADNPLGSAVIDPEGRLFGCEHCIPGTAWGSLEAGITNQALLDSLAAQPHAREMCRHCPMLPCCTAFAQCPLQLNHCREARTIQLTWALRHEVFLLDREARRAEPETH